MSEWKETQGRKRNDELVKRRIEWKRQRTNLFSDDIIRHIAEGEETERTRHRIDQKKRWPREKQKDRAVAKPEEEKFENGTRFPGALIERNFDELEQKFERVPNYLW